MVEMVRKKNIARNYISLNGENISFEINLIVFSFTVWIIVLVLTGLFKMFLSIKWIRQS